MLRDAAAYAVTSLMGFACLGLLALIMARDTFKDADVGPLDQ